MNREFLLSICMMVKDEEKNLRRCLDSLQPLLDKKEVELIIVDTGSKDGTVKIASEYTSKLYFHQWNNDFSEMRNISISYAKGDRILIIDADEVLLDAFQLYDLITDKRLQSFNTFIVKIKNFSSKGMFTILPQERVFRNDGDFKYVSSVHNQPQCKPPYLDTDIYVDHFGYLFDDDKELRERKFIRTGGILQDIIKKDPDHPYYRYQMARSYNAHNDKKEALDEIRTAHRLVTGNEEKMRQFAYIYSIYAIFCCENNEFDEAIQVCKEGIGVRAENIDLYFVLGTALIRLDSKEEALEAYKKYIDLVGNYDKLAISSDRSMEMHYMCAAYQDDANNFIVNKLLDQRDNDQALEYAKKISDVSKRTTLLARILLKKKDIKGLKALYIENQENKNVQQTIINLIETEKENFNSELKEEHELIFSYGEDIYSLLNKIRNSSREERRGLAAQTFKLTEFEELPNFYAEIFADLDTNTRQLFSVLKRLKKSKIVQYIKYIIDNHTDLKGFLEDFLIGENVRGDDFQSLKLYIGIAYVMLLGEAVRINKSKTEVSDCYYSIFRLYIERGIKYIALLYNTDRLRLNYSTFEDQEDRFFAVMYFALESMGKGDSKTGIKYFSEAVKANKYLICYMNRYKDELFPDLNETIGEGEDNG